MSGVVKMKLTTAWALLDTLNRIKDESTWEGDLIAYWAERLDGIIREGDNIHKRKKRTGKTFSRPTQ